jgi:hypothetical protein
MSTLVKGQSSIYLVDETVEGTYVAETVVAEAIEPLQDGLEFTLQREEIERKTLTDTIEAVEPRLGLKTVTGTIPMEYKAGAVAGAEPRGQILYESLLGGKRAIATTTTTKAAGNTSTVLHIEDADIYKFNVNDCVLVKKAGAYEVRPISAKSSGAGTATITFPFALKNGAPGASVVIEKTLTYFHDAAAPSFSVTHYLGGEIKEEVHGCKANTASLEGWAANGTPSISFGVEGIEMVRSVDAPSLSPNFAADSKVPVLQHACAWIGSNEIDYTEMGLSMENTKADLLSACSPSGKIGTRKTAFAVSGSINPYMSDVDVTRWDDFEAGTITSLFTYAFNPTSTTGEFNQVVAIWMPNIKIINMPTGDNDGVLMDAIEFKAFRSAGNDTVFLSFI